MRFLRRSLIGLFLASLTLAILALAGHTLYSAWQLRTADQDRPRIARERVFSVSVLTAVPETVTPVLTTFGEVRSRRTLDLRAPASGTVLDLAAGFEDGAAVQAGQLLVRLDPANAETARDLARADLARAEADLRDATRAVDLARDELAAARAQTDLRARALARQQDLVDRGVGTEATVETAALALSAADQAVLSRRQAVAQAEARIEQAANTAERQRISLAEAERRLAETAIRAGFSGTLAEVAVVSGGLVGANERLAQIVDPDDLEVSFRVSTAQFGRLVDDTGALRPVPLTVALDVYGTEIVAEGAVSRVGATVGAGQTGRLIFARLERPAGFRPGDFVTVRVAEPDLEEMVVLPAAAVDSAQTVLALSEDDRLETVPVTVMRRQGDMVIVSAPTLHGREVVAERAPMLGAGIRVRPLRPAAPQEARAGDETAALIELTPERRAQLIAFVEGNVAMPADARARMLAQLAQERVPRQVVDRLEQRMGG